MKFEWDPNKNRLNIRKHRISFVKASSVFLDDNAILYYDPDHSRNEDRFLMLGLDSDNDAVVVVHCYINEETTIRIISARYATTNEAATYYEQFERM